jgi:CYTH domain-containing protein
MLQFQDFVIPDQIHKESMAVKAAELVPEDNVLIIYDRALMDDKAYITDDEFCATLAKFGRTEVEVLANYDAVLHLVTCAKGAEFAYNFGNEARTESLEYAREMDDKTLRAWQKHRNLTVIDNSVDFEEKINRAIKEIYRIVGEPAPLTTVHKYLIKMPDLEALKRVYNPMSFKMMQTYLRATNPQVERIVRQQSTGSEYLYFYTEKRIKSEAERWETEKPISEKHYIKYLMECDTQLCPVVKTRYCISYKDQNFDIDIYPFSTSKALMEIKVPSPDTKIELPPELQLIMDVTNNKNYKNRQLAQSQDL